MATYASPQAVKWTILFSNSIIFIVNCVLLIALIVQLIGIGPRKEDEVELIDKQPEFGEADVLPSLPLDVPLKDEITGRLNHESLIRRFPSLGSTTVRLILILSTLSVSMTGSIAANAKSSKLLHTYGYLCFISFFVKYLFVIASISMIGLSNSLHKIGFWLVSLMATIGLFELVLGMSACQYSSILKRGDAAEPKILKIPVPRE